MNNVNSIIYEGVEYSIFGTILEFKSMSNLLLMNKTDILDGMIVYVKDEDNYYIWFTSNDSDLVTDKWRVFNAGNSTGTGSNFSGKYSDLTGTPEIDVSLTKASAIADAKATGDAIKVNTDKIDTLVESMDLPDPYIDTDGRLIYLNGNSVVIEKVDDKTNKASYYVCGELKEFTFGTNAKIIAGGKNKDCLCTSVVMNSGTLDIIHGGSYGVGNVATATIVINGGTIKAIYGGGCPEISKHPKGNHTGIVNITVNNTDNDVMIYGGGYSYASIGTANTTINGGKASYITPSGTNGHTASGHVIINGGDINVAQGVNRGTIGDSSITINGGKVNNMYAGVEPGGEATGTFNHSTLHLLGGKVTNLYSGNNNNDPDYDITGIISGEYKVGIVDNDSRNILGNLTMIE